MNPRWFGASLALLANLAGLLLSAPVPVVTDTVTDRKDFVPYRKYESLAGKAIGVLVSDVVAVMSNDGRGGPPDAMAFSRNGGSHSRLNMAKTAIWCGC